MSGIVTVVTGRMPRSGKLPVLDVLDLLTGQKSGFSPRRSDSLHRFTSNLAGPTGTWVRLAVQNFSSIATGVGMRPQKYQKFPLLESLSTMGGPQKKVQSLTDFYNFMGFNTPIYVH